MSKSHLGDARAWSMSKREYSPMKHEYSWQREIWSFQKYFRFQCLGVTLVVWDGSFFENRNLSSQLHTNHASNRIKRNSFFPTGFSSLQCSFSSDIIIFLLRHPLHKVAKGTRVAVVMRTRTFGNLKMADGHRDWEQLGQQPTKVVKFMFRG